MADFIAKSAADYPQLPAKRRRSTLSRRQAGSQSASIFLPARPLAATLTLMARSGRRRSWRPRGGLQGRRGWPSIAAIIARTDLRPSRRQCVAGRSTIDLATYQVRLEQPVVTRWRRRSRSIIAGPGARGRCWRRCSPSSATRISPVSGIIRRPSISICVTEALKLAFADREATYGDPRFVDVPLNRAARRTTAPASAPASTSPAPSPACPRPASAAGPRQPVLADGAVPPSPDTSYVAVVDPLGQRLFGDAERHLQRHPAHSRPRHLPILRGSQSFTIEGHPSEVAPGKRPRLTPNPALAVFDGEHGDAFGSPGGDVQTQSMLQVLFNLRLRHGPRQRHRGAALRHLQLPEQL